MENITYKGRISDRREFRYFTSLVTFCRRKESKRGIIVGVSDMLFGDNFKEEVEALRSVEDQTQQKVFKLSLPIWYPGGVYKDSRGKDDLLQYSGFIALDFDEEGNAGIDADAMKRKLSALPFVAYCGLSARGKGVFALVKLPVYESRKPEAFNGYFLALQSEIQRKVGLTIDPVCKNQNRGRFVSFDAEPYYNPNAEIYTSKFVFAPEAVTAEQRTAVKYASETRFRVEDIISQAERNNIVIASSYTDWFLIGKALANEFGLSGMQFFVRISDLWERVTGKEQMQDPEATFKRCLCRCDYVTIGTFFLIAKKSNLYSFRSKYYNKKGYV